jgi:hypothetical protein
VWDAVDESLRRNIKLKLELSRPDRQTQAWKRVVLGRGSKADIVKLCGVSEGTVAHMRGVKMDYEARDALGRELRAKLHRQVLEEVSWTTITLVNAGVEDKKNHGGGEGPAPLALDAVAHGRETIGGPEGHSARAEGLSSAQGSMCKCT